MRFSRKKGFTLWEILVIVVVISIGMMAIISLLTYGLGYVQKSRQKIIAINLAREGIESIYQIRDTNRQRRAGRKEECWLKINPLVDSGNDGCMNDPWIQSGSYILTTNVISGQNYLLLTGYSSVGLNIGNGIDTQDLAYSLCFSGGVRVACP
jgi:type II secretory pathway pseudopilin PulG